MRQTKRFAVVGSDARQAAAGRALARAGYTVGGVQQLPPADYILLPLPLEQSGLPLAQLLGAAKPVIKAHGSSKAKGIKNAIRQAKLCVANDLCGTMQSALAEVAAKAAAEKIDAE